MKCGCRDATEALLVHACLPHYWVWLAFTCDLNPPRHPRWTVLERALVSAGVVPAQAPYPKKKAPAGPAR